MQTDFATTAVRTDILQVGVVRRYETNNWNALKTKELLRKKSRLLRITTENEEKTMDQTMDQNDGPEAKISKEETRTLLATDLRELPPPAYQNFSPRPNFAYGNSHPNNGKSYDERPNQSFHRNDGNRSRNGSFNIQNGNWRKNGNPSCSPSTQRRDFSQNISYGQSRSDQPNDSTFRRFDNGPTTGFTPYEQKFPQNKNQTPSNEVRFTTTEDTINELSDLCPLNY